jgi:hypothetical protein
MIEKQAKGLGRERNFEERIQQQKDKYDRINLLNTISMVSSGQLAANCIWTFGTDVLAKVRKK